MPALYERNYESITPKAILKSFVATYEAVHRTKPECEYLSGNWFLVNGQKRDRRWVLLEVENLRQSLIASAVENSSTYAGEKRRTVTQLLRVLTKVS